MKWQGLGKFVSAQHVSTVRQKIRTASKLTMWFRAPPNGTKNEFSSLG